MGRNDGGPERSSFGPTLCPHSLLAFPRSVSRKPGGFLATARVEKGLPKGPDIFLDYSERLVYVKPLNEHTHIVTFRVGLRALVQALQPIAHQLRLAQILHHRLLSRYRFLLPSLHGYYLPIDHCKRSFYACSGVVRRDRDAQPEVRAHL